MSLTDNQYWNGTTHAVLTRANVTADWGSGSHSSTKIDAANRAFCIWYHARQTLSDSVTEPHWNEMYSSLVDCGTEGWGTAVNDLQEAFDHIDSNGGNWTDDTTSTYFGGNGKSYKLGIISDMPESCANFLEAVDDKLPALKEAMQEYQRKCAALQVLRLTQESTSDWEQIKNNIDTVKTAAERIKPLAWLIPAGVSATVPRFSAGSTALQRIESFADGSATRISQTISFLDTVGNIHDSLTVYVDATRVTGDRRIGVAFAALSYAMTYLPVLGGFYGTIIQKIPGLIADWTDFMEEYHRTRLHPEIYLRSRGNRPQAWRCEICNSSGNY